MFASSNRKAFIGLVLCPFLLTGCAIDQGMEQLKGAGIGTAAGAALGCVAGAVFGGGSGCAKGAVIGAAAGLVTGWGAVKIRQYQAEPVRTAQTDQRMYPMVEPVKSAQVKIRKGTSTPNTIKAGESVMVSTDYSVTLPPHMQTTEVTERWDLMKDGKTLVDIPQQATPRTAGGWATEAEIPIPVGEDNTKGMKNFPPMLRYSTYRVRCWQPIDAQARHFMARAEKYGLSHTSSDAG